MTVNHFVLMSYSVINKTQKRMFRYRFLHYKSGICDIREAKPQYSSLRFLKEVYDAVLFILLILLLDIIIHCGTAVSFYH